MAVLLSSCQELGQSLIVVKMQEALNRGECDQMSEWIEEEAQRHSENARFWYYRGLCENRMGEHDAAIESLRRAEKLNIKTKTGLWLNLAASEAASGQVEAAIGHLELLSQKGFRGRHFLERADFDSIRSDPRFKSISLTFSPGYNLWTSLFLFVALQALFIAVVLFRSEKRPGRLLAIMMLCFSITIFSFTLYWSGYNIRFPYLNGLYHFLPYLVGPLLFLYTRNSLQNIRCTRFDAIHFIPVVILAFLIGPWILANFINIDITQWSRMQLTIGTNWYTKILSLTLYFFALKKLMNHISFKDDHLRSWFNYLIIAYTGYVFCMLSYYVLVQFSFFNPAWDYGICFALSFFIFVVSFMGYLQPRVFAGEHLGDILRRPKYTKTGLTELAEMDLKLRLEKSMTDDDLYRNGDLRLDDLAEHLQSSRHNVSLVINKHFNSNYFDFLNKYRIEYVKRLMKDPEHVNHSIIHLAYEAGFNNKVSFNRAFKKFTTMTPTEYRSEIYTKAL